jgi:hypothetical protein
MMCGRYDNIEATGLDFFFEALHIEHEAFRVSIYLLVVDQRARLSTYAVTVRVDGTPHNPYLWT